MNTPYSCKLRKKVGFSKSGCASSCASGKSIASGWARRSSGAGRLLESFLKAGMYSLGGGVYAGSSDNSANLGGAGAAAGSISSGQLASNVSAGVSAGVSAIAANSAGDSKGVGAEKKPSSFHLSDVSDSSTLSKSSASSSSCERNRDGMGDTTGTAIGASTGVAAG